VNKIWKSVKCVVFVQLMVDGTFAVSRRTWIDTEGSRWSKRQWTVGLEADSISMLIGEHTSIGGGPKKHKPMPTRSANLAIMK